MGVGRRELTDLRNPTQPNPARPEQDILSNLFKLQVGSQKHWNIYAHSFLQYGHVSARQRMWSHVASGDSLLPGPVGFVSIRPGQRLDETPIWPRPEGARWRPRVEGEMGGSSGRLPRSNTGASTHGRARHFLTSDLGLMRAPA